MINPLKIAESYIQSIKHGSPTEKVFSLIPVVNNVFLEVKRFQFEPKENKDLKKFAETVSFYLWPQLILWGPALAKLQGYLSFKWRTIVFISLAIYYPLSEKHIRWVKDEVAH